MEGFLQIMREPEEASPPTQTIFVALIKSRTSTTFFGTTKWFNQSGKKWPAKRTTGGLKLSYSGTDCAET